MIGVANLEKAKPWRAGIGLWIHVDREFKPERFVNLVVMKMLCLDNPPSG